MSNRHTPEQAITSFWARVDRRSDDECWPWLGAAKPDGYGMVYAYGDRTLRAHRVAYELAVGAIPPGLQLDHLCRNRNCVNPKHLEPVTPRENTRRGMAGAHNRGKAWGRPGMELAK